MRAGAAGAAGADAEEAWPYINASSLRLSEHSVGPNNVYSTHLLGPGELGEVARIIDKVQVLRTVDATRERVLVTRNRSLGFVRSKCRSTPSRLEPNCSGAAHLSVTSIIEEPVQEMNAHDEAATPRTTKVFKDFSAFSRRARSEHLARRMVIVEDRLVRDGEECCSLQDLQPASPTFLHSQPSAASKGSLRRTPSADREARSQHPLSRLSPVDSAPAYHSVSSLANTMLDARKKSVRSPPSAYPTASPSNTPASQLVPGYVIMRSAISPSSMRRGAHPYSAVGRRESSVAYPPLHPPANHSLPVTAVRPPQIPQGCSDCTNERLLPFSAQSTRTKTRFCTEQLARQYSVCGIRVTSRSSTIYSSVPHYASSLHQQPRPAKEPSKCLSLQGLITHDNVSSLLLAPYSTSSRKSFLHHSTLPLSQSLDTVPISMCKRLYETTGALSTAQSDNDTRTSSTTQMKTLSDVLVDYAKQHSRVHN